MKGNFVNGELCGKGACMSKRGDSYVGKACCMSPSCSKGQYIPCRVWINKDIGTIICGMGAGPHTRRRAVATKVYTVCMYVCMYVCTVVVCIHDDSKLACRKGTL